MSLHKQQRVREYGYDHLRHRYRADLSEVEIPAGRVILCTLILDIFGIVYATPK